PKPMLRTTPLPSANVDPTSTLALGNAVKGSPWLADVETLACVSDRMPTPKYVLCPTWSAPCADLRSPPCAGISVFNDPAGDRPVRLALSVTLMAVPRVELGGAKSNDPNREA